MARDIQVNGPCLVEVKGHGALSNFDPLISPVSVAQLWELGLAKKEIIITPTFIHKDINVDDFGPNMPADIMWLLADVRVRMQLIHYDQDILRYSMIESTGGVAALDNEGLPLDGTLVGAGEMLGNGLPLLTSGNHFISLNLRPQASGALPWRFPSAYLVAPPFEFPVGSTASIVDMTWRGIAYAPALPAELASSGAVLWDHTLDVRAA